MADFDASIDYLLASEGGYVNHPADKGGPTNFGVTQKTYSGLGYQGDVKDMSVSTAKDIYRNAFWSRLGEIDDQDVATIMLDLRANGGSNGTKVVQKALNNLGYPVAVDGGLGSQTISAVNEAIADDRDELIQAISDASIEWYQNIVAKDSSQSVFLKGWTNRAKKMLQFLGKEVTQVTEQAAKNPGTSSIIIVAVIIGAILILRGARNA